MQGSNTNTHGTYVIILSGTHVTGKETLAVSISNAHECRWIKSEWMHSAATKAAVAQSKRGFDYKTVFGRVYSTKLQQVGFDFDAEGTGAPSKPLALLSCFHMTPFERDAMRQAMLDRNVKPIFAIMHITTETLSGRTLGAEEPELAARIMATKASHIQEPLQEETDVIVIDSMKSLDVVFAEMTEAIRRRVTGNVSAN